jgi:hypothetical protein
MAGRSPWVGHDREDSFDCAALTHALQNHGPQLEELDFQSHPYSDVVEGWPWDFGSLRGLAKLHTLRIGIDRFAGGDGSYEHELYDPHVILPKTLRHVEVVQLPIRTINAYCAHPANTESMASGMQLIVDTARGFSLESLKVGICTSGPDIIDGSEETSLTGAAVSLLKGLVRELLEKENVFQVYHGNHQKRPKYVLFGRGGLDQAV